MANVKLQSINKRFGESEVLKSLALDIKDGEFLTLVGPSGCGKSTLLRIIAGLEQQTEGPAGGFYLMDSIQTGSHQGAYCEQRRDWLKAQLDAFPGEDAFLFIHHPPFRIGIEAMDSIGIKDEDARALGELLDAYGNIRHLFFGHLHRPLNGCWRGISFSTLRATNHQVWLDFRSGDIIAGSHEPPAYAIAFIDDQQVVIHTHDFMDASPKFDLGSWKWEEWHKVDASKAVA